MKKITKVYEGITFDELSEHAKDRVRQWYVEGLDYDWWNFSFDNFIEEMSQFGIDIQVKDIEFSGFWSQGDGLCFSANMGDIDTIKYLKATGQTKKFWALYLNLIKDNVAVGYAINGKNYWGNVHGCDFRAFLDFDMPEKHIERLERQFEELRLDIENFCRDKAVELYRQLEREYEYLTSDESIKESAEANEWYFDKHGRII